MACRALERWQEKKTHSDAQFEEALAAHDAHLLKMSKRFAKQYAFNIFKLNACALRI